MGNLASPPEVLRIANMADPVLRNRQITESYHVLSRVFAARLGPTANWCTFAAWASKQAGQTIRSEDLSRTLENQLSGLPEIGQALSAIVESAIRNGARLEKHAITRLIWETIDPKAAMTRAGIAVARGNQKVYAEIAPEFARFIENCLHDEQFVAGHIEDFCSSFRSGDPPGGQRFLRQAFARYYQALFEQDVKIRAEHIFLANLEIGFHEQTRLQPDITEALEASIAAPAEFKKRLLVTLFPRQSWMHSIGAFFTRLTGRPTPLDTAIKDFAFKARLRIRLFLTEHMMTLGLPPDLRVRLGEDLTSPYPPSLQYLANPDLLALLQQIDPTPDSLRESGATDWAHLPDRLHFIADLFRSYQEKTELLRDPFAPAES